MAVLSSSAYVVAPGPDRSAAYESHRYHGGGEGELPTHRRRGAG
jgi:hypothetical protein